MHVLDLFAKSNRPIQEKKQEEKTDADQAADNVKSKDVYLDPELQRTMSYAQSHYPSYKDPQLAFDKWVQRSLANNVDADQEQDDEINRLKRKYDELAKELERIKSIQLARTNTTAVAEGIFSNIFNKKPNQQTHSGPAISQFDSVDPYTILGISRGANTEEIKNAYRKLATVYHPDKPTGDQQKFQKINMAYRSLMGRLEETFLPEDILDEAAPWVDKLGLGNWFRKIKDKDATNQQGIRILSGVNHAAQLYFKTILALNASVSPALSLFWPLLGKQALLFLGGAVVYTIGKILATKIGRALFGSTEEALAFAKAHLKAGEEKKTSFIFDGKTYPVTVIDYDTISKLKYQIFELENLISSRKSRADYADYLKTQKEQEKTKQLTRQQGVAEAKSPEEFMAQISKSNSSILTNKKESPYYIAGKMLSKYADNIGQDSMDFADFKQHAALLMGGPEDNMRSAKQVRNLDTAASDIILDMIWEYSSTQKDADTYYKISGFKRLRENTKSTTVGVEEDIKDTENILSRTSHYPKTNVKEESTAPSKPVEAYGYMYNNRDQRVVWRKIFPSGEAAYAWADKRNATVLGTREVDSTKKRYESKIQTKSVISTDGTRQIQYQVIDAQGNSNVFETKAQAVKFFKENLETNMQSNPTDRVTMDVPLLLRVMEFAKEDAKTDMDLHDVAENLIELGKNGKTLSMGDYDAIVNIPPRQEQDTTQQVTEVGDRYWCKTEKRWKNRD